MQTRIILSDIELMLRDIHNHNGRTGLDHCRFNVQQSFIVISLHATLRSIITGDLIVIDNMQ